ncbi:MAG: STAS domain-containing protein [Terracidiphilus sp.]
MMTTTINPFATPALFSMGAPPELVRGSEQALVERLRPVVRRENVVLDLEQVERIDAAGIAALVTLYAEAGRAGTSFHVANPRRHVAELLELVGLDSVLVYHTTASLPHSAAQPERCAA